MSDLLQTEWFSEVYNSTAYSLRIKKKLYDDASGLQHIQVYETVDHGNLLVMDGCVMLTSRDNFLYHEMMSHPILFSHACPKKVLIIGGGDCGTLREVLKHDCVEQAWQVDIDEKVTRVAEEFFPELCDANDDPRANIKFADGIQWVKDAEAESLDVIIVDSTDPVGPAEGLFSTAFYQDCYRALAADGMIVQQCESPIFHPERCQAMWQIAKQAGFQHIQPVQYPQPCYPSGWWSAVMASKTQPFSTWRHQEAQLKKFATRYYNVDIHRAAFALPEFLSHLDQ